MINASFVRYLKDRGKLIRCEYLDRGFIIQNQKFSFLKTRLHFIFEPPFRSLGEDVKSRKTPLNSAISQAIQDFFPYLGTLKAVTYYFYFCKRGIIQHSQKQRKFALKAVHKPILEWHRVS